MSRFATRFARAFLVAAVVAAGTFVSEDALMTLDGSFVTSAEARIGRPLTPFSYAGVARRTTRRAVAVGVAAGAVYAAPMVAAPMVVAPMVAAPPRACVQAVDPYGRLYMRCY